MAPPLGALQDEVLATRVLQSARAAIVVTDPFGTVIIESGRTTLFDTEVTDACLHLLRRGQITRVHSAL